MTVRLTQPLGNHDVPAEANGNGTRAVCALVNNMPDGAFDATERQYLGLLGEGSGSTVIEVHRYTMPGVPRGEQTSKRIAAEYFPLADIYLQPPDLLIVTGSNPVQARMQDELYWADLVQLLEWSRQHVRSTLLSCLTAHAALTLFDGIERVRLPSKCTGVFPQYVEVNHALTAGLDPEILLPHSRWNTAPREAVEQAGFAVIIHSEMTGWAVATREEEGRQLLLVQGHPEYDPSSLLREYRRDASAFVNREVDALPCLPYHCVAPEDWGLLEQIQHAIIDGAREPRLIERYPFDEVGARAPWPWRPTAVRFYSNWTARAVNSKE